MGVRYRKRISLGKLIKLNVSKSGLSLNVGIKGASMNFGKRGTYANLGIPGTGIYSRQKISNPQQNISYIDLYKLITSAENSKYGFSIQDRINIFLNVKGSFFAKDKLDEVVNILSSLNDKGWYTLSTIRIRDPFNALLLSIFLGVFGIDRFFIGNKIIGLLKLMTLGGFSIGVYIDWFIIGLATRKSNYNKIQELNKEELKVIVIDDDLLGEDKQPIKKISHIDISQMHPLFVDAARFIINSSRFSPYQIKQIFNLSYVETYKIIDELEQAKIISKDHKESSREILVSLSTFEEALL